MSAGEDELVRALKEIPPKCRAAFFLFYVDELSSAQVALQLGISERRVFRYVVEASIYLLRRLPP